MKKWKQMYDQLKNDKDHLDLLVEYFQLIIVDAARKSFGFKKFCDDSINWIDRKVHHLLKKKKSIGNKISHEIFKLKKRYQNVQNAPKYRQSRLKKLKKMMRKLEKN